MVQLNLKELEVAVDIAARKISENTVKLANEIRQEKGDEKTLPFIKYVSGITDFPTANQSTFFEEELLKDLSDEKSQ